jgi:Mn2+/Fe2+ NRAMP family transporter
MNVGTMRTTFRRVLATIGPGVLVAATGVGVGDIAGAGFAGSKLGYAVLWAAVVGSFIKFVVNEGLARWQLATGRTLLEGAVTHFGRPVQWLFLAYLLVWSWAVGSALISASGVAAHAMIPLFNDPQTGKVVWGIAHSAAAVALILLGGFKRFGQVMTVSFVFTFVAVIVTAATSRPNWGAVAHGLLVPRIPTERAADAAQWTLVVMGGVGGTLTMLCYGYWIREQGRRGPEALRTSRIDLSVSYAATALFGVAMVVIGAQLDLAEGKGAGFVVKIADRVGESFGRPLRWLFLFGAWATVFDSLLGVWQSVPYLFADFWQLFTRRAAAGKPAGGPDPPQTTAIDMRSGVYRGYLLALATVPAAGLWFGFVSIQKAYSVLGAVAMPLLALALLVLNGRSRWVGPAFRNRPLTVAALIAVLLFFLYAAWMTVRTGREVVA